MTEDWVSSRRHGFDPWVRKIPGEGNGNPFQYSCLGNPMGSRAWWTTVHRVSKSQTRLMRPNNSSIDTGSLWSRVWSLTL